MKIAFLIWDYAPSRGGQERYLSRLAGAIARRGHEIHIFATRCEHGADAGMRFHRVPVPAAGPSVRAICYIRQARAMLARERFDIVSGLTRFYPLDVYRMGSGLHKVWLRKKSMNPLARIISYTRPFTWLALYLEGRMFDAHRCSRIIANSRLCRDQLLSLYRYPADRTTVVYNGVDHDFFHPRLRTQHRDEVLRRVGLPGDKPLALFVSNNLRRKGLDTALRAISVIGSGAPSLVVAGAGCTGRFRSLARKLGIAERVRFLGRVPDVRPYYGAADYLILPTRYDPFANVCLEAMACGLPVVTTRDNGAAELIEEGVNGLVIADPDDSEAIARGMGLLADGAARGRMAEAAREKSLAFTVDRNAEETLAVYRHAQEERDARQA